MPYPFIFGIIPHSNATWQSPSYLSSKSHFSSLQPSTSIEKPSSRFSSHPSQTILPSPPLHGYSLQLLLPLLSPIIRIHILLFPYYRSCFVRACGRHPRHPTAPSSHLSPNPCFLCPWNYPSRTNGVRPHCRRTQLRTATQYSFQSDEAPCCTGFSQADTFP